MKKISLWVMVFVFVLGGFSSWAFGAEYDKIVRRANALYKDKKYEEALKLYQEAAENHSDQPRLNFDLGAAQFKTGDFDKAGDSFQKASTTQDRVLEAKANYNLGNAKYMAAKQKEALDLSGAVNLMAESLGYYKRALDLDVKDNDIKFNHEFVSRELKLLEEKLKNEPPQAQQKQSEGRKDQREEGKGAKEEGRGKRDEGRGKRDEKEEESQSQRVTESESSVTEASAGEQKDGEAEEKAGQGKDVREMSRREARMLLDGYEQEELSQGAINDTRKSEPREVLKDW